MSEATSRIEALTQDSFRQFGTVITASKDKILGDNDIVTHWHNLANLQSLGPDPVVAFVTCYRREFVIRQLERHVHSAEIFFPQSGYAAMPFALSLPDGKPDVDSLRVFLLTPETPFVSEKGIWHWVPFPIGAEWKSHLLVEEKLIGHDIEVSDLETPIQIALH